MRTKLSLVAFCVLALTALLTRNASAQSDLELPEVSQKAVVQQRVGVTDITITYHRPLVNGRKIGVGSCPWAKFGERAQTRTRRSKSALPSPSKASRCRLAHMGFT